MTEPFDVHDHRHELKQLRDEGDRALFENRGDVDCPVCGRPVRYLFVLREPQTINSDDAYDFCVAYQETDQPVVTVIH